MAADLTRRDGIPVTSPSRTIDDLRRVLGEPQLRRAIRQAEVLGLALGPGDGSEGTRSELERLFLRLCRRHRIPQPEVNARVGPYLVDFLWRDRGLVVEADGYRYHRGRQAFEDDRARDLALRLRGLDVMRFSHRQVVESPAAVIGLLSVALGAGETDRLG